MRIKADKQLGDADVECAALGCVHLLAACVVPCSDSATLDRPRDVWDSRVDDVTAN